MIWEHESTLIVMVTNLVGTLPTLLLVSGCIRLCTCWLAVEKGRIKCNKYWPDVELDGVSVVTLHVGPFRPLI
jgi:hypothetical protein